MKVFKVFNHDEVDQINSLIDGMEWRNGKDSALGAAKDKKENFQINSNDKGFDKLLPFVNKAHMLPSVKGYTFVKEVVDPRVASYQEGGHYDWHVDVALLRQRRTDLSFSIFLRDSDSYDGGEMEMQFGNGIKFKVKGKIGEMVVYPSGLLHKVNPVTSGERRVIVGWISSNVKYQIHRERLNDFLIELSRLREELGSEKVDKLNTIYHQLVRDFS
jgi:PKHD-type hydroxylase